MMTLKELKQQIENNSYSNQLLIFKNSDNDFIATQYYREIAKNLNLEIKPIDDLSELNTNMNNLFGEAIDNCLYIYREEKELKLDTDSLMNKNNLIIICNKVEKETKKLYNDYIIEVPKLEEWQIIDYIKSNAKGLENNEINYLMSICKNDIQIIQNELDKLSIFDDKAQKYLLNKFKEEGIFSNLTSNTIFNLTNAIVKKDINTIKSIYKEIKLIDTNEMGFISILYNSFKSIINIQLNPAATAESCGLTANQFWYKKKEINYYTRDQLLNIFNIITDLDRQIKTGEIDTSLIIDYLLVKILSV